MHSERSYYLLSFSPPTQDKVGGSRAGSICASAFPTRHSRADSVHLLGRLSLVHFLLGGQPTEPTVSALLPFPAQDGQWPGLCVCQDRLPEVHVWVPCVTSGVSAGTGASVVCLPGVLLHLCSGFRVGAGEQLWSLAVGGEGKGRLILQHLLKSVPPLCRCSGALS